VRIFRGHRNPLLPHMSSPILIRPAEFEDASAVAQIYTESILARDSTMDTAVFRAEDIVELLNRLTEREQLFVLAVGSDIKGWGIVKSYSNRPGYAVACETSVYLFRDTVGNGLGSRLQRHLLEYCRQVGYHHVVTKIWAENESSIAFHARHGFTLVGIQHEIGRIDGQWKDIALMECVLRNRGQDPDG